MLQHVTAHHVAGCLNVVWMSALHKMNTPSVCSALLDPLPPPLHYSYKQGWAARRERGMRSEGSSAGCQPWPRRPALFINPAQPLMSSWCLQGFFGTRPAWDGQIFSHGLPQRLLSSLKRYWRRQKCSLNLLWMKGSASLAQQMAKEGCGWAAIKYTCRWVISPSFHSFIPFLLFNK